MTTAILDIIALVEKRLVRLETRLTALEKFADRLSASATSAEAEEPAAPSCKINSATDQQQSQPKSAPGIRAMGALPCICGCGELATIGTAGQTLLWRGGKGPYAQKCFEKMLNGEK
jgi:hypothetical protein